MIHCGDSLTVLRTMPDASVQMCVTSPPYWGLRSYGTAPIVFGGDPAHAHVFAEETIKTELARGNWAQDVNGRGEVQPPREGSGREMVHGTAKRGFCECGAWLGHLGLEPTPEMFVAHLVEIFREVRRILKPDGVLWCNMGDSYATGAGKVGDRPGGGAQGDAWGGHRGSRGGSDKQSHTGNAIGPMTQPNRMPIHGLKPKDLVGIPWRVAFALQADGWFLRCDVIWNKPNPMPSSVKDRPTIAHEYVFLLSKQERYFYDHRAIMEPLSESVKRRPEINVFSGARPAIGWLGHMNDRRGAAKKTDALAGVSGSTNRQTAGFNDRWDEREDSGVLPMGRNKRSVWTISPQPFKGAHFAVMPQALVKTCILAGSRPGDTVLDPFSGAGTTGVVCEKLLRGYVGIELNPAYVEMATRRINGVAPLFNQEATA